MKTITTLTAAIMVFLSTTAFAFGEDANEKFLADYTISKYVNAVSHGKIKGVAELFDNTATLTTSRNNEVVNYNKTGIVAFIKSNENVEQNCYTSYQYLEKNNTQAVIKVSMQYEGFTKVTIVNMANTTKGWKITNLSDSFE